SFPLCADPEPARAGAYELALELYAARDARRIAVTPKMQDGLVDIPVAIPDDETMVERLRLAGDGAARQWFSMLEATYGRVAPFPARRPATATRRRSALRGRRGCGRIRRIRRRHNRPLDRIRCPRRDRSLLGSARAPVALAA